MRSLIVAALLLAQPALALSPTKAEMGPVQWKAYVCRVFSFKGCALP
jgi:hypothetical protein